MSFLPEEVMIHFNAYRSQVPIYVNSPIQCVIIMLVMVYVSKLLQALLSLLLLRKYDNVNSTYRYAKESQKHRSFASDLVQRAYNAHANQWEAFIGFSVATLFAYVTKTNGNKEVIQLCNLFILIRLVYNIVYILAFNIAFSVVRSSVWTLGIIAVFRMLLISYESTV